VYVIADIHGQASDLLKVHKKIQADLAKNEEYKQSALVYLGDYVDRGPNSYKVMEIVLADHPWIDWVERLHGNHEQMMWDYFLGHKGGSSDWLNVGGAETLISYGLNKKATYVDLPDHHRKFLLDKSHSLSVGSFFFSHAGINYKKSLFDQNGHDLTWSNNGKTRNDVPCGAYVVHGHVKVDEPFIGDHRMNLDTGSGKGNGYLSCAVIQDNKIRIL
jgi:serine/threonine protein phosphatase 1